MNDSIPKWIPLLCTSSSEAVSGRMIRIIFGVPSVLQQSSEGRLDRLRVPYLEAARRNYTTGRCGLLDSYVRRMLVMESLASALRVHG